MSGRPTSTARILTGVLGAAAVALGVFLALRPLTTLQVTVWAAAAALVGWAVVLGRARADGHGRGLSRPCWSSVPRRSSCSRRM